MNVRLQVFYKQSWAYATTVATIWNGFKGNKWSKLHFKSEGQNCSYFSVSQYTWVQYGLVELSLVAMLTICRKPSSGFPIASSIENWDGPKRSCSFYFRAKLFSNCKNLSKGPKIWNFKSQILSKKVGSRDDRKATLLSGPSRCSIIFGSDSFSTGLSALKRKIWKTVKTKSVCLF